LVIDREAKYVKSFSQWYVYALPITMKKLVTNAPVEICGEGKYNVSFDSVYEDCPSIEVPEKPEVDVNSAKWFRVAIAGDVEGNDSTFT